MFCILYHLIVYIHVVSSRIGVQHSVEELHIVRGEIASVIEIRKGTEPFDSHCKHYSQGVDII